jgi:hypothetical protein
VVLVENGPRKMRTVEYRFEVVAPFVHFGINFRRSVRVSLSMVDGFVAQFYYKAFDLGMANEELQKH